MGKIFINDAYNMGLIYFYEHTNRRMISIKKLNMFYHSIEKKLMEMGIDNSFNWITVNYDNEDSIYYKDKDDFGNDYLILKDNFDYQKAKKIYIDYMPDCIRIACEKSLNILISNKQTLDIPNDTFLNDVKECEMKPRSLEQINENKKMIEEIRQKEMNAWINAENYYETRKLRKK